MVYRCRLSLIVTQCSWVAFGGSYLNFKGLCWQPVVLTIRKRMAKQRFLNRYLEDYLRCFTADNPRRWLEFLPWAKWHYNTAWHPVINMTPFEAVFVWTPPTFADYIWGTAVLAAVDEFLVDRATVLSSLQKNLQRTQTQMRNQANFGRTDIQFQPEDWVLLKLQPYH